LPAPHQIIKGCWQLDGKHQGDPVTDRTAGGAAIDDMERFVRAGTRAGRALGKGLAPHRHCTRQRGSAVRGLAGDWPTPICSLNIPPPPNPHQA
jgi:hypothetical protein